MSLHLAAHPSESEVLAVDPNLEDADGHLAKRPRLDDAHDPSLEDDAVMSALEAHNNAGVVDQYGQEYVQCISKRTSKHRYTC
jgi:hypothetical protein